jgi:formate-dependent nitrite reductase membrane component NrfD
MQHLNVEMCFFGMCMICRLMDSLVWQYVVALSLAYSAVTLAAQMCLVSLQILGKVQQKFSCGMTAFISVILALKA